MASVLIYHNLKCLNCGKCNEAMVKVGPMVFCNDCYQNELLDKGMRVCPSGGIVKSAVYQDWITVYKELPT